jgi:hypothetical protein
LATLGIVLAWHEAADDIWGEMEYLRLVMIDPDDGM